MTTLSVPKNLELTEPSSPDMPWVVTLGNSTPLRITPDLAKVLKWHQDGRVVPLIEYIGHEPEEEQLNDAIALLKKYSLLTEAGTVTEELARDSRLRINSLFSIQFALLNRPSHFAWLEKVANKTLLIVAASLNTALAIFGILAIVLQWDVFQDALTSPQPPTAILLLFIFLIASVSIHEFAHGAVLAYFGGQVRRMGVMLFYLSPAFFCDVTDAWKLQKKHHRTLVALAGVNATFGIAGLATMVFTVVGQSQQWLALGSLALYVGSILNLVPFIKLDGYIALMTHLDIPNMRAKSMDEWKKAVALLLTGKWKALSQFSLSSTLFGMAASATPIVILLVLAGSIAGTRAGILGAFLGAAILIVVMVLVVRGIYRVSKVRVPNNEVSTSARIWIASVSVAATVAAASIPVPLNSVGAYWESNGELVTNLEPPSTYEALVTLRRDGLFASKTLGTAVITSETVVSDMPVQALSPNIKVEGFPTKQPARRLRSYEGLELNEPGSALFKAGFSPLGCVVMDTITLGLVTGFLSCPMQSSK